jgi:hypothetical protein
VMKGTSLSDMFRSDEWSGGAAGALSIRVLVILPESKLLGLPAIYSSVSV